MNQNSAILSISRLVSFSLLFALGPQLMAQVRYPAVDEFQGMYNGRSIFEDSGMEEEAMVQVEVLFNSEDAKISPTMAEIKAVGDAVAGFEKDLVAALRATGVSLPGYVEGSYLVPGDRTIRMLPGRDSLFGQFNCERLSELLAERFPLWRVVIGFAGTEDVPIIYPGCVIIPKKWQGREKEYWDFILATSKRADETSASRLEEMAREIVVECLRRQQFKVHKVPGLEYAILACFEVIYQDIQGLKRNVNVWVRTDNRFPGKSYRPSIRTEGFWGSRSVLGVRESGDICEHSFGNSREEDQGFIARVHVFTFEADRFQRKLNLRLPETGEHIEIDIPGGIQMWRQVEGAGKFERVQ